MSSLERRPGIFATIGWGIIIFRGKSAVFTIYDRKVG
jgi:hypothetical protein